MFQINYRKLIEEMPIRMNRTPIRLDWLELLIRGTKQSYDNFNLDYLNTLFIAKHTNQRLSLEHFLNNYLSLTQPITITDGMWLDTAYLDKTNPRFLNKTTPMYLRRKDENNSAQYDFVVNVSTDYISQESEIRKWVDYYKLAETTYIIKYL